MQELEYEAIKLSALIRATEDWSSEYAKDPTSHAKLLRTEARMQVDLTKFFRDIAKDLPRYIDWHAYSTDLRAATTQKFAAGEQQQSQYNVDVIVRDVPTDRYDGTFIKVVFEELAIMTAIGAQAGEAIYGVPLGIQSTDAIIQQLTTQHVANLVGKKLLKDGSIVDNPKATYRISDKTRTDIAQSVKTSLNLGETVDEATARLQKVIANPNRAKIIAQTESVNTYQAGLYEFGAQSGAVGKEWQDVGAVDVCADYAAEGPVPFDYLYGGTLTGPTAHTRCRCGQRLIYQAEWDKLNH